MLPERFQEQHVIAYCKKLDKESISVAMWCFHEWCKKEDIGVPKVRMSRHLQSFFLIVVVVGAGWGER